MNKYSETMKPKYVCEICGITDVMIGGGMLIHKMQKTKDGKLIRYKTTYFADQDTPCHPCRRYVEHPLENGAVEHD